MDGILQTSDESHSVSAHTAKLRSVPLPRIKIAVLGAYRSGSSALAAVLDQLGVWMGAPYYRTFFEPADLSTDLRRWWGEPDLVECTPAQSRVDGLRRWLEGHSSPNRDAVGAKHPLLSLSCEDLLEAWGPDTKFLWAHRNLEASVASLAHLGWMKFPRFVQTRLWREVADFCSHREHYKVPYEEMVADPAGTIRNLVQYLGLEPTEEQIRGAGALIKPPAAGRSVTLRKNLPGGDIQSARDLANWLIDRRGYRSYLEIGEGRGSDFDLIRCTEKNHLPHFETEVHSDLKSQPDPTNSSSHPFDLVMVKASAGRETLNRAILSLSPGGMILCDDLLPLLPTESLLFAPSAPPRASFHPAWLDLRQRRPDLPMLVAKVGQGVGIVFPDATFKMPKSPESLTTGEEVERNASLSESLNLIPPGLIEDYLTRSSKVSSPLSILTVWSGEWNSTQASLLHALAQEQFPRGSRFIWVVSEATPAEAALEEGWEEFNAEGRELSCEVISIPSVPIRNEIEKHLLVTAAYSEALPGVESEWVLLVEEEITLPKGAVKKLLDAIQSESLDMAAVGAWSSRGDDLKPNSKPPAGSDSERVEVLWAGGELIVYRTRALKNAGRLYATTEGEALRVGRDANLGKALLEKGYRLLVDRSIRVERRSVPAPFEVLPPIHPSANTPSGRDPRPFFEPAL